MQITFNPKDMNLAEATIILGMALPALVKGAKAQGDTKVEVMAGIAELTEGVWDDLAAAGSREA